MTFGLTLCQPPPSSSPCLSFFAFKSNNNRERQMDILGIKIQTWGIRVQFIADFDFLCFLFFFVLSCSCILFGGEEGGGGGGGLLFFSLFFLYSFFFFFFGGGGGGGGGARRWEKVNLGLHKEGTSLVLLASRNGCSPQIGGRVVIDLLWIPGGSLVSRGPF